MKRPVALLASVLAGCTLVDQRTFNPEAGRAPTPPRPPAAVAARPAPPGPPPLLTIDMARPDVDRLASTIAQAVAAARARKPGVVFDVVEAVPPGADPGPDVGRDAAQVAGLIQSDGIPPSRINLVARPEADPVPRQVRVYVR